MKRIFLAITLILIIIIFLYFGLGGPPAPDIFVENRTVTNFTNLFYDYEISKYYSDVEIIPLDNGENVEIGFVSDTWNLRFGKLPGMGSYTKREMTLTNKNEFPSRIILKAYGNVSPLVVFNTSDFVLGGGEQITIDIYCFANNTGIGIYSGEIDIISKRPKYQFIPV